MIKGIIMKRSKPIKALLLLISQLVACSASHQGPHLGGYDSQASSSSFGEPFFRLEPPNQVTFANTQGATIVCLASGLPKPTISWYSLSANFASSLDSSQSAPTSDSLDQTNNFSELHHLQPVSNVTNLRQILQDGQALRLLPFAEADFRQDIHSTEYKCIASNQLATIHSRSVLVQAVINNRPDSSVAADGPPAEANALKVNDEFVSMNSIAVFKCKSNGSLGSQQTGSADFEWFTSDGLQIKAGELSKGNKFTAFKTGELHIANVDSADLRRTYGCRLRDTPGAGPRQPPAASSSGLAQLIVTDSYASSVKQTSSPPPQILHTISQVIVEDSVFKLAQLQQQQQRTSSVYPSTDLEVPTEELYLSRHSIEWKLLLPCAVKNVNANNLRWLYQPYRAPTLGAKSSQQQQQPIPIEQWASMAGLSLVVPSASNSFANDSLLTVQPSKRNASLKGPFVSRLVLGPSYLALEWPRKAFSGRFLCQLLNEQNELKPMCDISVIIRQPLKIKVETVQFTTQEPTWSAQFLQQPDYSTFMALQQPEQSSGWLSKAVSWFQPGQQLRSRLTRRAASSSDSQPEQPIRVTSRGLIANPPILLVGQHMQLNCFASGFPIEQVRWFKNGHLINLRSASDFQIEIQTFEQGRTTEQASGDEVTSVLISSLIVRQLQPKLTGFNMFECFAQNSAGDRARASRAVFIADPKLLQWASKSLASQCVEDQQENELFQDDDDDNGWAGIPESAEQERAESLGFMMAMSRLRLLTSDTSSANNYANAILRRNNPFRRALIFEFEPAELTCPTSTASKPGGRIEWRRFSPDEQISKQANNNFNQLFTASTNGAGAGSSDSRFLINGSSLQIRSPSKRHDEAIYVCRLAAGSASDQNQHNNDNHHHHRHRQQQQPRQDVVPSRAERQQAPPASQVHQSSLASSSSPTAPATATATCAALSALFSNASPNNNNNFMDNSMSSISIRIVAKPKIDPFEFSRNLEEGMRAVVVCAVVSGQSPIDIIWFKDGDLLLADNEQISIDQANGFSSTITFHKIKPKHSGLYTCVASNAFASTNHTSPLIVNEPPYFIEAPKNTQAILNSNVLIDCRAGGQPTPQIRWRKLVPAIQPQNRLGAPTGGSKSFDFYPMNSANDFQEQQSLLNQMAVQSANSQAATKFDFKIVTSNSHIQILENGSMIIKEVEFNDASKYVCQAFNGINPSLSELIDLQVLSPAQFEVKYETVSVKRDSMIKFSCAPKGDQPMRIDWFKEEQQLAAADSIEQQQSTKQQTKYSEIQHLAASSGLNSSSEQQSTSGQRHNNLVLQPKGNSQSIMGNLNSNSTVQLMKSSELIINYADRADTGLFICIARNPYGKDELTYRLVVQEVPDIPLNVHVQNVAANSLKLMWLSPFDGNLAINHYVVEYRKLLTSELNQQQQQSEWSRLVISTSKLTSLPVVIEQAALVDNQQQQLQPVQYSLILRQLNAKSSYQIRVAAVNSLGQGLFSPHLTFTTAEEPPSAKPNDLRAQAISTQSVKILWRGPAPMPDEPAPIKGYYVSFRKYQLDSPADSSSNLLMSEPQNSNSSQRTANGWQSTHSINVLNSSEFQQTSGPESENLIITKQQLSPASNGRILNYEYLLSNLAKNTKYEIRVQAYNSMGIGPSADTVCQTLKFDRPNQPVLKLLNSKRSSLELKWSLKLQDDQPLLGFSLFYKCEYDDWQEIRLGLIYQYLVENLRCGNKYQLYLSAFNMIGRSDPSDVLTARTEGSQPIAPEDRDKFIKTNISEVTLDMSLWLSGGCPINNFMVQYKHLPDAQWYILSEQTIGAQSLDAGKQLAIGNLIPASWYKLMITALNEAGPTNAEYIFSTLDLNGQQIPPPTYSIASQQNQQLFGKPGGQSSNWFSSPNYPTSNSLSAALYRLFGFEQTPGTATSNSSLLLSMSCLLILLVTSIASYLYYSRGGTSSAGSGSSSITSSLNKSSSTNSHHHHHHHSLLDNMNGPRTASLLMQPRSQPIYQADSLVTTSLAQQQQSAGSQHLLQHHLIAASHQPSNNYDMQQQQDHMGGMNLGDSNCFNQDPASNVQTDQQQQMLDSFIKSQSSYRTDQQAKLLTGNYHANQPQNQQLSQLLSNTTNSSSLSTHSTQCFDTQSSSAMSQATQSSGGGNNRAPSSKLQLIDESLSGEQQTNQFQLYDSSTSNNNSSPMQLYAGLRANNQQHVDCIISASDNQTITFQQPPRTLLSSTSFASAADLLQRQQQQQQLQLFQQDHQNIDEPIYQRLDKFQAPYGGKQFAIKAQTLRFQPSHHNSNQLHHQYLDQSRTSMTMHRLQQQAESQQQQQMVLDQSFYPPPPLLAYQTDDADSSRSAANHNGGSEAFAGGAEQQPFSCQNGS